MNYILSSARKAAKVNPADEVESLLVKMVEQNPSGFAIGLHVSFTTSKFLFQTYRKDWMEEYSRRGFILHDPTVRWGLQNNGSRRWSDLAVDDQAGVFEAARRFGLNYGVTIALEEGGTKSFGSVGSSEREFTEEEIQGFLSALGRMHRRTTDDVLSSADAAKLRRLAISSTHS